MSDAADLERLWTGSIPGTERFDLTRLAALPATARQFLGRAIAPGTPLARAVRLTMHGEIRIGTWCPFTAEQVIAWPRGMIWTAAARKGGLPIRGSDRIVDGAGAMRWKLLGLIPVVTAAGPDITRSAAGRMLAECALWLPSVLAGPEAGWRTEDAHPEGSHARVRLALAGTDESADVGLKLSPDGAMQSLCFERWGNPDGHGFGYAPFGGIVEADATFGGHTIPTRMRAGWYLGTDRFETEGEFFRVTIERAAFR